MNQDITLQHTATHCNALPHTATHLQVFQMSASAASNSITPHPSSRRKTLPGEVTEVDEIELAREL